MMRFVCQAYSRHMMESQHFGSALLPADRNMLHAKQIVWCMPYRWHTIYV
jgi:hypothetical protein